MRRFLGLALVSLSLAACSGGGQGEGHDAPMEIEVGKVFEWNGFKAAEGWHLTSTKVSRGGQDVQQPDVVDLKVTNTGETTRFALFRLEFGLGSELVAAINCTSESEIAPAGSSTMVCPGLGAVYPTDYDSVLVGKIQR
ncbi:MAG: hypothetical protein V9G04_14570 [Nocardioides sp.]